MTEPTGGDRPMDEPQDAEPVVTDLPGDASPDDVVDAEVVEDAPAPRRSLDLPEDLGGPAPATDFAAAVPEGVGPEPTFDEPSVEETMPARAFPEATVTEPAFTEPTFPPAAPAASAPVAPGGSYLDLPPLPEVAPAPPVPPPYAAAPTAGQAYGHGAQPATPPTWQQPAQPPSYPVATPGYQSAPVPYGLDTTTASMAHWLPLAINVLSGGMLGFLAPLVLMQTKGAQDPFVRANAVESLNLNLTVLVGYLISFVLLFVLIGFLTFPLVGLYQLIFQILGALAANRGETYRYPVNIRFVK